MYEDVTWFFVGYYVLDLTVFSGFASNCYCYKCHACIVVALVSLVSVLSCLLLYVGWWHCWFLLQAGVVD